MMDNDVKYIGNKYYEMEMILKEYINDDNDIINFLNFAEKNSGKFGNDFFYEAEEIESGSVTSGYNKRILNTHYFLNIKGSLFHLVVAIIGYFTVNKIPDIVDIGSTIVTLIQKISEEKGDYCIVTECSKKNSKVYSIEDICTQSHDCVNNHYNCMYNRAGKCSMSDKIFEKSILELKLKGTIIENDSYKVTF